MSGLPDARPQNPSCGCCENETRSYDADGFTCEDCELWFDSNLRASFLDPDAEPCNAPCENGWHGDNKIWPGFGFDCGTCKLPSGHTSMHWTGCERKQINTEVGR